MTFNARPVREKLYFNCGHVQNAIMEAGAK